MEFAIINRCIAPIRSEASDDSTRTDEALYGMVVQIISERSREKWCYVKTHYGYTGYVNKSCLLFATAPQINCYETWRSAKKMTVIASFADVLESPKIQSGILENLPRGSIVEILDTEEAGWQKVRLWAGSEGFMRQRALTSHYEICDKSDEEILRINIVNAALSYLGVSYRWGGKSPLGIDCSGLCSMAYMICGVVIYRDAKIMEGYPVRKIPMNQMNIGDLLYFPGHIALYIGDGKYVHSTAKNGSDGVVINSLRQESPNFREDLLAKIECVGSIF